MISCGEFQSTPSAWRETVQLLHLDMSVIFQSTPSAWRETHAIVRVDAPNYISIHSLRMEGDLVKKYNYSEYNISIHPSAWRETL